MPEENSTPFQSTVISVPYDFSCCCATCCNDRWIRNYISQPSTTPQFLEHSPAFSIIDFLLRVIMSHRGIIDRYCLLFTANAYISDNYVQRTICAAQNNLRKVHFRVLIGTVHEIRVSSSPEITIYNWLGYFGCLMSHNFKV